MSADSDKESANAKSYSKAFADVAAHLKQSLQFEKELFPGIVGKFRFAINHRLRDKIHNKIMQDQVQKTLTRLARKKVVGGKFIDPNYLREHMDVAEKFLAEERAHATVRYVRESLGRLTYNAVKGGCLKESTVLWRRMDASAPPNTAKLATKLWHVVVSSLKEEFSKQFDDIADDGWAVALQSIRVCEVLTELLNSKPYETGDKDESEYQSGQWFSLNTVVKLTRLRKAASRKTKRVHTKKINGVVCYRVADARRWWSGDMHKA